MSKNKKGGCLKSILIGILIFLLIIFISLFIIIKFPSVQTKLVKAAATAISKTLNADVTVGSVDLNLKTYLKINDVLVKDYKNDTMIYVGHLTTNHSILKWIMPDLLVKDITIDGAKFYLNNTSTDSTLNLVKSFSSNKPIDTNATSKTKKNEGSGAGFKLRLENALLTNTTLVFDDIYGYKKIDLFVKNIEIISDSLKPMDKVFDIKKLSVSEPLFKLTLQAGDNSPTNLEPAYLDFPLAINVGDFSLENAHFLIDDKKNYVPRKKGELLFSDLDASGINIGASDVKLRRTKINALVNKFTAKEKSGLEITDVKADFELTSQHTIMKDLKFATKNSVLNGFLKFDYNTLKDYMRFAKRVNVTSTLKNSKVLLDDISYFVLSLKRFSHLDFRFNTKASGIMNQLNVYDLDLDLNHKAKIQADILVQDMFLKTSKLNLIADIKSSTFDKKTVELIYNEPVNFKQLDSIGTAHYKGKFEGDFSKFALTGDLISAIGDIQPKDLNLDLSNMDVPLYKGQLVFHDANLSKFLGLNFNVNQMDGSVTFDGKYFDPKTMQTRVKGTLNQIFLANDMYHTIDIDGNFDKSIFDGLIDSKDKYMNLRAEGKIDMTDSIPDLRLGVKLNGISLQRLKITEKDYKFTADLFLDGKGSNLENFDGELQSKNFYTKLDTIKNEFSDLLLKKDFTENGEYDIEVKSKEIEGSMIGHYQLNVLPKLLQDYFITYLTGNSRDKNGEITSYKNTNFNLELKINNIMHYTEILLPQLKNIEKGYVNAKFNGAIDSMDVTANLVNTDIALFSIPNVNLNSISSENSFNTRLKIDSVYNNNNLLVAPIRAKLNNVEDGLKVSVELLNKEDEQFVDLNVKLSREDNNFVFNILPFTSYYGRKIWDVSADNSITLNTNDKLLIVKDLSFSKDNQVVSFNTQNVASNDLLVNLNSVQLSQLISGFLPNVNAFEGSLNGNVKLVYPLTKPTPVANVTLSGIKFKSQSYGDMNLISTYENDELQSDITMTGGAIEMKTVGKFNSNTNVVDANIKVDKLDASILDSLLPGLVYDVRGNAKANIDLTGTIDDMKLQGGVLLDSMTTGVGTLFTVYHLNNQYIPIEDNMFKIKKLELYDRFGNMAVANGTITHQNLSKFNVDITANTDKLIVLNSERFNNPNLYGTVFAKADARFSGQIGKIISIKANVENLPESKLTMVFASQHQIQQYSFYEFVDKSDTTKTKEKIQRSVSGVAMDFNINVNRNARVTIIMNPEVDDKIEARGDGNLAVKMAPDQDLDIKGTYTINSGSFLFTYQNLVQRTFYLNPGGRIAFVGDPFESLIDATATFRVRANAQDLVKAYYGNTNEPDVIAAAKKTVKVNVILKIKDKLTQPDISYELDIEQNNPTLQSAFESIETITRNNENELNKQVTGLLVFQRFFPPSTTGFENTGIQGTDFANTAIDVVTGRVSGIITDWMQSTFKGINFDLNYRSYSEFNSNQNQNDLRNQLKFAFSQKLLNDRLILNVGGNYDFGNGNNISNQNNSFFGGDVDIEYLLNKPGNLRFKFYSTLDTDPLNAKLINKTGLGLYMQLEFNRIINSKKDD